MFFALELILRDFEADAFGVVVLSSFVADIIGRAAFGSHPFLTLPRSSCTRRLSTRCTLVSASCARSSGSRSFAFSTARRTLPTASGAAVAPARRGLLGLLLLALPELYGVGYPQLEDAIRGRDLIGLLLLLLVGKLIATSVTIAIGGSGGVFAPSLIGAMLGTAYGATIPATSPRASTPHRQAPTD